MRGPLTSIMQENGRTRFGPITALQVLSGGEWPNAPVDAANPPASSNWIFVGPLLDQD
jgi:hypothetical protein